MPPSFYSLWLVLVPISFRCGVSPSYSVLVGLFCVAIVAFFCGADLLVPKRLGAARGTLAILRICQRWGTPARRNQELSMISRTFPTSISLAPGGSRSARWRGTGPGVDVGSQTREIAALQQD